jgi:FlaA1/EpsC-like NDP-sugar epimerase
VLAVLVSLWTWSITAGFPFSAGFVLSRAVWFLAVPAWLAVLFPLYDLRTALSIGRTARGLAHAVAVLLAIYLALYFYAPRSELPRLVARVVIVGVSEVGRTVHELLRDAGVVRTSVAGFVDDEPRHWGAVIDGAPVLGGSERLPEVDQDRLISGGVRLHDQLTMSQPASTTGKRRQEAINSSHGSG